jgi:H+-translocating NAD(P) transhydrogenase subunit alpha
VTAHNAVGYVIAFLAAAFAAANVVGGYVVTGRMLKMFRRRPTLPTAPAPAEIAGAAQPSVNGKGPKA